MSNQLAYWQRQADRLTLKYGVKYVAVKVEHGGYQAYPEELAIKRNCEIVGVQDDSNE
jgi:hypothetical protein